MATTSPVSASVAAALGMPVLALLAASLVAGLAYPFLDEGLSLAASVTAKGAGVCLLALAAVMLRAREHYWLATIMAAGALGDILLALPGLFFVGAGAFAIGHVVAILFYMRNRSDSASGIARLAALALIGWGLAMPTLVSPPGTPVGALMLYSVLLCGMAAALLLSRFPRLAVVGALLFIVSDTLLIMRLGGRLVGDESLHGLLVWLTYYLGQLLIFIGVASGLLRSGAR
jgi:uncharacterized membrane protein YhhN